MIEILKQHPKAAEVMKNYYINLMIESAQDLPDHFKEFLQEKGLEMSNIAEMMETAPRNLFDVFDEYGIPVHSTVHPKMAQDHINDALQEHDIQEAAKWVVRPVYAAPQAVPAEPSCPDCHAPHLLYECVHCSASNYPAAPVVKESDMEPHDQNWIHGEDV